MNKTRATIFATAMLLAACKAEKPADNATAVATPPPQAAAAPPASEIPGAVAKFDISSTRVSTVALGPFPFIALPEGYAAEKMDTKDFARFPFWYGDKSNWVEGKFFQAAIVPKDGKQMSQFELKRNFGALVQQMGGVQVAEGKIPYAVRKGWGDEINAGFYAGANIGYEPEYTIWAVRRGEGNIWIQLTQNDDKAGYVVGQEKAFVASAKLLPASEMKQQIATTGKVALQVNFATDKTEILPDSLPQIDQVVQLMKDDPALKLAVNGHTDDTGTAAHNLDLSQGRARAVVAALMTAGIDAARLQPAGFGDAQPVADNGSEEGKARNRRVELVKL